MLYIKISLDSDHFLFCTQTKGPFTKIIAGANSRDRNARGADLPDPVGYGCICEPLCGGNGKHRAVAERLCWN